MEILEDDNVVTLTTTVGFTETKALDIDYDSHTLTKTFTPGDQIGIFYKDTGNKTRHTLSNPLTEDDITNNGKSGKFTFSLTNPKAGGEFRYIYPAPFVNLELGNSVDVYNYATICYYKPLQSQDGTLATLASTLDLAVFDGRFTEEATLPATAMMANQFAICAYTLKNSDGTDITGSITRLMVKDGTTRSAAEGPIYVAIRPTSGANIEYTANDGTNYYFKSVTGKTYDANNFYQLGLRMTNDPDAPIPGVFTVNSNGKRVRFAKGNLTYNSNTWSFLDNSWSYNTNPLAYSTSDGSQHFYWYDVIRYLPEALRTAGWYALSSDEWRYLLGYDSHNTPDSKRTVKWHRFAKITVSGTTDLEATGDRRYILIFPDSFKGTDWNESTMGPKPADTACDGGGESAGTYTVANFTAMQNAGIVILPAASCQFYSVYSWDAAGCCGHYWTSTVDDSDHAYFLYFNYMGVCILSDPMSYCLAVRLVQNVMTDITPLTVEALTAGTVKVDINGTLSSGMKYSVNGGEKTLITTSTDIAVSAGDKVQFYGNGTATRVYGGRVKILGSGDGFTCKAYGNIMSLLDEDDFAIPTALPNQQDVFNALFRGNTALTDAGGLLLPATSLSMNCYAEMFRDCTSLITAPSLPSNTLAQQCYWRMFRGCSALTAAPELPATTLVNGCYAEMFQACSALTTAPDLPATTLLPACYSNMFNGCSNLNSVKCLATSGINERYSTDSWLNGVASTGTFYHAYVIWPEGVSGIPGGWTRKYPDGHPLIRWLRPKSRVSPYNISRVIRRVMPNGKYGGVRGR